MKLILEPLQKAINALIRALNEYDNNPNEFVKDSCIQRFEFTYDLSQKMIRRYLENTEANPEELKETDFQGVIRKAYEKGLIVGEWEDWRQYRKDRGSTSHAYNEDIADQVFRNIPDFLQEAQALLSELEKRNDNN